MIDLDDTSNNTQTGITNGTPVIVTFRYPHMEYQLPNRSIFSDRPKKTFFMEGELNHHDPKEKYSPGDCISCHYKIGSLVMVHGETVQSHSCDSVRCTYATAQKFQSI